MKIICQSCQSKYNVADDKVQGKVVKIRCRKCGATIVVNGAAATAVGSSAVAGSPASSSSGAGGSSPMLAGEGDSSIWHVNVAEDDQRTMTFGEVVSAYRTGLVTHDTFIWTEGMDDWKPLGEVDAVVSALDGGAAAPKLSNGTGHDAFEAPGAIAHGARAVPAAPESETDDGNDSYDATRVYDTSAAGDEVAAIAHARRNAGARTGASEPRDAGPMVPEARASEPRGADPRIPEARGSEPRSADPRIPEARGSEPRSANPRIPEARGSEPRSADPRSGEPKRAAVLKRDARARDLFASRVSADEARPQDVQTSAPAFHSSSSAGAGNFAGGAGESIDDGANKRTGERNENSVLFSLAVLTKGAEERAPLGGDDVGSDDSGLIDLKALAAKTESMRPPTAVADASVFSPPLGAMPPLGAPLGVMASPLGEARPKSRLPLWIGGGALVAVLLVGGIAIGVTLASGTGTPATGAAPSATASASEAPGAPAETASAATPTPSATASTTPSASASVATAPKPKPTGGGPAFNHPSPPKSTANTAAAAPETPAATAAPPPKKTGGDCGCNGDLMCLMKCSTH